MYAVKTNMEGAPHASRKDRRPWTFWHQALSVHCCLSQNVDTFADQRGPFSFPVRSHYIIRAPQHASKTPISLCGIHPIFDVISNVCRCLASLLIYMVGIAASAFVQDCYDWRRLRRICCEAWQVELWEVMVSKFVSENIGRNFASTFASGCHVKHRPWRKCNVMQLVHWGRSAMISVISDRHGA